MRQTPDRHWILEPAEVLHYMESAETAERLFGTPIVLTRPISHVLLGNLLLAKLYLSDGIAGLEAALEMINDEQKARRNPH